MKKKRKNHEKKTCSRKRNKGGRGRDAWRKGTNQLSKKEVEVFRGRMFFFFCFSLFFFSFFFALFFLRRKKESEKKKKGKKNQILASFLSFSRLVHHHGRRAQLHARACRRARVQQGTRTRSIRAVFVRFLSRASEKCRGIGSVFFFFLSLSWSESISTKR